MPLAVRLKTRVRPARAFASSRIRVTATERPPPHGDRAPSLLLLEVANALRTAERRGRLRPALRRDLLDDFLSLPIALEHAAQAEGVALAQP